MPVYKKERYGTAGCAAPELYTTDQSLDQRTDIYAIGAVLHFMLYGTLNAGAGTDCRAEVSKPLQNVIRKCMEPDREKQYASAKELEQALEGSVWSGRMVSAHKKSGIISEYCDNRQYTRCRSHPSGFWTVHHPYKNGDKSPL